LVVVEIVKQQVEEDENCVERTKSQIIPVPDILEVVKFALFFLNLI
jgi:hypothetical protein